MEAEIMAGHEVRRDHSEELCVIDRPLQPRNGRAVGLALALNAALGWRVEHQRHVAKLALEVFADLRDVHDLDAEAHLLLECAALVHEVGLGDDLRPRDVAEPDVRAGLAASFDRRQAAMVSAILRFHRYESPDHAHVGYRSLGVQDRLTVRWCSAILWAADGFDSTRQGTVRSLLAHCDGSDLVLVAGCAEASPRDVRAGTLGAYRLAAEAGLGLRVVEIVMPGSA